MDTEHKSKGINITTHSSLGVLWMIGWLFTIAFAKLTFWKGVLGLFIWPYYLGLVVR